MKNFLVLLSSILLFAACQPDEELIPRDPVHEYFKEITLGSEFSPEGEFIRKWKIDPVIYLAGTGEPKLEKELDRIIQELNVLLAPVQIRITDDSLSANYFVFFGSGRAYAEQFNPEALPFIRDNFGLYTVQWNEHCEIYRGSMYIDTQRCKDMEARKHLLREELTQSLGFFNDSFRYPTSIFQEKWTRTTFYNEVDRKIINLLYDESIRPCTDRHALDSILNAVKSD